MPGKFKQRQKVHCLSKNKDGVVITIHEGNPDFDSVYMFGGYWYDVNLGLAGIICVSEFDLVDSIQYSLMKKRGEREEDDEKFHHDQLQDIQFERSELSVEGIDKGHNSSSEYNDKFGTKTTQPSEISSKKFNYKSFKANTFEELDKLIADWLKEVQQCLLTISCWYDGTYHYAMLGTNPTEAQLC